MANISVSIFLCVLSLTNGYVLRELVPIESPANLTLLEIQGQQVLIEWDPVDPFSIRGTFRGYLIRAWSRHGTQIYAFPPDVTKVNVEFFPYSKNFITVAARNEKYVGPPSNVISFDAPQIEPNAPRDVSIHPLGASSVLLQWSPPSRPNGLLLGYKIYCTPINGSAEKSAHFVNPAKLQAKLTGLEPDIRYRIDIAAVNCAGEGSEKRSLETQLDHHHPATPSSPKFTYRINYTQPNKEPECHKTFYSLLTEDATNGPQDYDYLEEETQKNLTTNGHCLVDSKIVWLPDVSNIPGEYFYLKYRQKGQPEFHITQPEMSEDFTIIHEFDACKNYEIILVVVDGDFQAESNPIITPTKI